MKSPTNSALLALAVLTLSGCQTAPQVTSGPSQTERIAIVGTNDIHGVLAPLQLKTRENPGVASVEYEAGGASVLSSYLKILSKEWGDRLIWLDAGDEFQGSIESNATKGAAMVRFFNSNHLTAAAVGNHEFDFTLPELKERMREADYPFLTSNIWDKKTKKQAELPKAKTRMIIQAGKLKVGLIGLSTLETPFSTAQGNLESLDFEDLRKATLREAHLLRKEGADIVVVTAHAGLKCTYPAHYKPSLLKKSTDLQGVCDPSDEMITFLYSLPDGTVDAVVAGHSHQVVSQWVANVPIIEGGAYGRYINVIYLTYDFDAKKLVTDQTRIEGPIPICRKVFQNQRDCNGDRPAPVDGRGPLVSPTFHGVKIEPDEKTNAVIDADLKRAHEIRRAPIGNAVRAVDHTPMVESALGNLAVDAMREEVNADFAFLTPKGSRAALEAGVVTFESVFRAFPFDNMISVLRLSGKSVKILAQIGVNGYNGFTSFSGLKVKVIDLPYSAPFDDLNHNGQMEFWKMNRLLDVRKLTGELLHPDRMYTVATSDFLVTGGDGYEWFMSTLLPEQITLNTGKPIRDALIHYIQAHTPINSLDHPIVDPKNPRLERVMVKKIIRGKRKLHSQ